MRPQKEPYTVPSWYGDVGYRYWDTSLREVQRALVLHTQKKRKYKGPEGKFLRREYA